MIVRVKFSDLNQKINVNFGAVQTVTEYVGGELYEGDYAVTPRVVEQTMPTKNRVLVEDMKIKEIPFFNVSNTSGGSTVYIGNEV